VGRTDGLDEVRRRAENFLATGIPAAEVPGRAQHLDTLEDYVTTLLGLVQVPDRRRLRVAVDAGNAMAGLTVPAVTAHLPHLEVIPLFFELDGTFPNHPPNPSVSENLNALRERVRTEGADLGLAFDGDADRCVVVDERGEVVPASAITALIGVREVARARAEGEDEPVVVANLVSSRHVQEAVEAAGGRRIRSRVGHAGIKALMAEHRAVFGGEHSAHYYFRDFFFADSGMLAALHVLAALAEGDRTLSALVAEHDPYVASGEINSRPADAGVARDRVEVWAGTVPGASTDDLDGLTVTHWPRGGDAEDGITDDDRGTPEVSEGSGDSVAPRSFGGNWWLSLRSSNTESLLRFNVEAEDTATMERVRDHVLGLIHEADDPEPEPSGPEPETVGNGPGPAMPSSVRALLRCPRCRGALADAPEGLTCLRCDARYVVLEGMADLRPPLGASADA
jgi:phosphomannomutase